MKIIKHVLKKHNDFLLLYIGKIYRKMILWRRLKTRIKETQMKGEIFTLLINCYESHEVNCDGSGNLLAKYILEGTDSKGLRGRMINDEEGFKIVFSAS